MTDKDYVVLVDIKVKPETRQQIEDIAQRRGYATTDEYVRALIESDAEAHGETLDLEDDYDAVEGFRQAWHEAMTGQTIPLSEIWDSLDDE